NNWGDDIKVQIPSTGISIGEFNTYLHEWLGNRTHILGEVFRSPAGVSVTARVSGDAGVTVEGKASDLAALIQKMAEAVYENTQPYRYGQYELRRGHRMLEPGANEKAQAVFMRLTKDDSALERAWAYLGLANLYSNAGDDRRAVEMSWKAVAAKPD